MTLSPKEKNIAIIIGSGVALLVLWLAVLEPYLDKSEALGKELSTTTEKVGDAQQLLKSEKQKRAVWTNIVNTGMKSEVSDASSQAYKAVLDWASRWGVTLSDLSSDPVPKQDNKFWVISFQAKATGSMRKISGLLSAIEAGKFETRGPDGKPMTINVPIKVHDVSISSRPEGSDNLTISMSLSTLCLQQPETVASPATTTASPTTSASKLGAATTNASSFAAAAPDPEATVDGNSRSGRSGRSNRNEGGRR